MTKLYYKDTELSSYSGEELIILHQSIYAQYILKMRAKNKTPLNGLQLNEEYKIKVLKYFAEYMLLFQILEDELEVNDESAQKTYELEFFNLQKFNETEYAKYMMELAETTNILFVSRNQKVFKAFPITCLYEAKKFLPEILKNSTESSLRNTKNSEKVLKNLIEKINADFQKIQEIRESNQ